MFPLTTSQWTLHNDCFSFLLSPVYKIYTLKNNSKTWKRFRKLFWTVLSSIRAINYSHTWKCWNVRYSHRVPERSLQGSGWHGERERQRSDSRQLSNFRQRDGVTKPTMHFSMGPLLVRHIVSFIKRCTESWKKHRCTISFSQLANCWSAERDWDWLIGCVPFQVLHA